MRKLPESLLSRLAEFHDGDPPSAPIGLKPVLRSGLAQARLTPAGLFALRTGFTPSAMELTLLDALQRGPVWPTRGWRIDPWGTLRDAPGTVLTQFRKYGLAARGRGKGVTYSHHATDACRELAAELVAHFGNGWAQATSPSGTPRTQ